MSNAIAIYSILAFAMSVACFAAYGLDKSRAVHGGRRVPELTLQILALSGGWPGGLLAQRRLRHKTKKPAFLIAFWCVVVLHIALVGAAGYVIYGPASDRNPLQKAIGRE